MQVEKATLSLLRNGVSWVVELSRVGSADRIWVKFVSSSGVNTRINCSATSREEIEWASKKLAFLTEGSDAGWISFLSAFALVADVPVVAIAL